MDRSKRAIMKIIATANNYIYMEFTFWDEQWQEHTEQTKNTNGGASGSTDSKEDDSKTTQRNKV